MGKIRLWLLHLVVLVNCVDAFPASAPDLIIDKSHGGNFIAGSNATYQMQIYNIGQTASNGAIIVTDPLPPGLSFVSASGTDWTCSASGQVVTCGSASSILPGGPASIFTLTVAVSAATLGLLTNTATVSNASDINPDNNSWSDSVTVINGPPAPTPDLTISKTHTLGFVAGANRIYTIRVSNVGSVDANTGSITVTDTLPAGLSYMAGTGGSWSCSASGQTVTCLLTNFLGPGQVSLPLNLTVGVSTAALGTVVNTATVSQTEDTDLANNSASDPTTIFPPPPAPIPTLSEWGLAVLTSLLVVAGILTLRRANHAGGG